MARSTRGEAEKKWRAHVEAWASSGLSVRAFALREGLNVGSLSAWRRRLQSAGEEAPSFIPVVLGASASRRPEALELVVGEGPVLRIPAEFDEATLARVVRALGAAR